MKSAPLKIAAFGTGNIGDDLMLQAILKEEPDANIIAYGQPCLPYDVRYIPTSEFMARPDRYFTMSTFLDFGGGNLFWSSENLADMLVLTQQAKLAGLPVRLLRVGLQGWEKNETYARLLLRLVDSVTVRDTQSLVIARQLGREDCEYVRDYAFELLGTDEVSPSIRNTPKKVGINFSDFRFTSDDPAHDQFIRHISGIFSELARYFMGQLEFHYIPFCNHRFHRIESDLRAGAILWGASDGLIKYAGDILTTDDLIKEVKSVDVLIGRRFHMQVLGHGLGKVVIPLVNDTVEQSKFVAMAHDHRVAPIPYVGVSQGYIVAQIKHRLSQLLAQENSGGEDESNQVV
jgi:polysaccharide pyruvyl transferase WcaK-like protein